MLADLRAVSDGRYARISLPPDQPVPDIVDSMDLAYARRGDSDLRLDVFRPRDAASYPGVLLVHGGGWERGDRQMERPFARLLAARGLVVATIDYRLGAAGRFPNALLDVQDAAVWLRTHAAEHGVAARPIGAVGGSSGGQLVALAGALGAGPLGAVVDIDGLVDFTDPALVKKESAQPGAPTRFLGGPFAERGAAWRAASALWQVGPRSVPTLFINSTAPTPILPGRDAMRARLESLGIAAEVMVMPGTPHPFWLVNPWFATTVDATARFLKTHL